MHKCNCRQCTNVIDVEQPISLSLTGGCPARYARRHKTYFPGYVTTTLSWQGVWVGHARRNLDAGAAVLLSVICSKASVMLRRWPHADSSLGLRRTESLHGKNRASWNDFCALLGDYLRRSVAHKQCPSRSCLPSELAVSYDRHH
jgi:hypothetical protein